MEESLKSYENAAKFAAQKGLKRFTRFLDPAQVYEARSIAKKNGVSFSCWGGFDRAERVIGCFYPEDHIVDQQEYPLVCLCAHYNAKFCHLTHKDILGAFMNLGLTRDCVGDMMILSDRVYLFASEQTAAFVASSLTSAGRVPLSFEPVDALPRIPEPAGTEFHSVVSSLRLDAMLAAAYRLSRNEAASCIRNGLVKVDHLPQERIDFVLKENSLLSLRGKGA